MPVAPQMVSANEAAALAMVEIRDVHRAFDEHLPPEALLGGGGASRQVARGAVPLLAFSFRTAGILQADARKAVIRRVAVGGRTGALRRVAALRRSRHPLPMGDGVSAELRPFIAETDARARLLEQARGMAVLDPEVLGGSEPVVRGTRVPVRDVAAAGSTRRMWPAPSCAASPTARKTSSRTRCPRSSMARGARTIRRSSASSPRCERDETTTGKRSARMIDLSGKVALVTGASRGIGAATALRLARAGAATMLAARSAGTIAALAERIRGEGGQASAVECDVAAFGDVEAAVRAAMQRHGGLDILVNNAGLIEPIARLAESDTDAWDRVIDVNVKGVYHGLRAGIPAMLAGRGGVIVNISSGAATSALEGWSHYCASKAAVLSLTRCADKEYGQAGIRVVGLSPGTVATDMQAAIKQSGLNPVSLPDAGRAAAAVPGRAERPLAALGRGAGDPGVLHRLRLRRHAAFRRQHPHRVHRCRHSYLDQPDPLLPLARRRAHAVGARPLPGRVPAGRRHVAHRASRHLRHALLERSRLRADSRPERSAALHPRLRPAVRCVPPVRGQPRAHASAGVR